MLSAGTPTGIAAIPTSSFLTRSVQLKPTAVAIVCQNGLSSASCRASVAVTSVWWIQVVGGHWSQFLQWPLAVSRLGADPSEQLQWIILVRAFVCHHLNKFFPFYLPSPLKWLHFITTSHPLHNLVLGLQRMKFTCWGGWWELLRCDEHFSSRNFLAEHIVSDRCQGVLLICIEQCYHCLTSSTY